MLVRILCLLTLSVAGSSGLRAQTVGDILGGAAVGTLISVPVALGYSALRAQSGAFIWNGRQGIDRMVVVGSVVVGLSAGIAIGAGDRYRPRDALAGAVLGGAGGAAAGLGIAALAGSTTEGRWAGTLIGLGAGTLVGSVWSAVARAEEREDDAGPMFSAAVQFAVPGLGR